MIRPHRLLLLLLPAALAVFLAAHPGRAEQAPGTRWLFSADTTLLRDTLGLEFDRLFPLADSLQVTPDTLRALAVRYRFSLERIVRLADSLRVPVDSVGPILERERFNPLASGTRRTTSFRYNSNYFVQQTSSTWSNSMDFNVVRGPLFVHNATNIQMDRFEAAGRTSLRQTRTSVTEGGWRFSNNYSLGGRLNLERFNSLDPGSTNNQSEDKNEAQLSVRTRQQPSPAWKSELNFFSGLLDLSNLQQVKQGVSGDLNGTLRYSGGWLTHDLTGQLSGNVANTRLPSALSTVRTNDLAENLRGTVGVLQGGRVGFNGNYFLRRIRVETPLSPSGLQQVRTTGDGADGTLRLRQDSERYLNVLLRLANQESFNGTGLNSQSQRRDRSLGLDGRYLVAGWSLEGRFSLNNTRSEYPTRALTGGYGESLKVASVDGVISRALTRKLVFKGTGSVSLNSYRYFIIRQYPNPPVNRDQYRQNYRLEGLYTYSERFNTAVALDVTRSVLVNIPAASTSSNNEVDSYRAEWRWSYRLIPGLTASQRNTLTADYTYYNFLPQNDRATLDYNAVTTLNCVFSPRFTLDVTHNARQQPSGSYTVYPDGLPYLNRTDESENYTLSARISYMPLQAFSLVLQPDYFANERKGAQGGDLVPQRTSRQLNFSGGASINLRVGGRGRVTGDILRTYRGDRSIQYTRGVPSPQPRNQSDFWNGSLQFTWEL